MLPGDDPSPTDPRYCRTQIDGNATLFRWQFPTILPVCLDSRWGSNESPFAPDAARSGQDAVHRQLSFVAVSHRSARGYARI